jgi:hypothetical protein
MKRTCILLSAALACHAALFAQGRSATAAFQPADSLAARGRGGLPGAAPIPRAETGKPFSATATTRTTQTLPDGTHLTQTTVVQQYRDAEGRLRIEVEGDPDGPAVTIRDPVAGAAWRLDTTHKTAEKLATITAATPAIAGGGVVAGRGGGRGGATTPAPTRASNSGPGSEELGTLTINGVPATGTRTTAIVPVGAIGNDREMRIVNERWFSPDLNLLIKSVNTDPRFGTTTYDLTNISRQPPDASLFRVPADYKSQSLSTPLLGVVEAIQFTGLNRAKAASTIRVGEMYDKEAVAKDLEALWKSGQFSDIQVKTEPGTRGGIILRYIVTEKP